MSGFFDQKNPGAQESLCLNVAEHEKGSPGIRLQGHLNGAMNGLILQAFFRLCWIVSGVLRHRSQFSWNTVIEKQGGIAQTADFTNLITSSGAGGSPLEHADLRDVYAFAMAALAMAVKPVVQLSITFVPGLNHGTAILAMVLLTLVHPTAAYNAGYLPLVTNQSICAVPPGAIATDGLDDVCILAKTCCPSWTNIPGNAMLSSGANVNCDSAVCANICRMVCDRSGTSHACTGTPLCELTITAEAYVFIRRSAAFNAGHPAFGFRAAPGLYFYGALENPTGAPFLGANTNNGFWMRNGTRNDMFCTMKNPPVGTDTAYDNDYKMFMNGDLPNVFNAVKTAEHIYKSGYSVVFHNSLNAVFHVLKAYGIPELPLPSDFVFPNDWYDHLDPATWTHNVNTLSGCTSPVVTCTPPGCSACETNIPGRSCCLLNPYSLAPTCVCGVFGDDCSQYGDAVFCSPTSTTSTSIFSSTTSTSTTSTSTTSSTTSSMTPTPPAGPPPGCSTCEPIFPGTNCCLLNPDSLAPTCICGDFEDCSQYGSPAEFCPA